MNEITLHGNIGAAPKISYGRNNGTAVVNFSIGINSRRFDRVKGQWVNRPTVWQDVVVFGALAENVYDSVTKGTAVTVTGKLADDSYTRESYEPGREDTVIRRTKLEADDVTVSLRNATVQITKVDRSQPPAEGAAQGESSRTAPQPVS